MRTTSTCPTRMTNRSTRPTRTTPQKAETAILNAPCLCANMLWIPSPPRHDTNTHTNIGSLISHTQHTWPFPLLMHCCTALIQSTDSVCVGVRLGCWLACVACGRCAPCEGWRMKRNETFGDDFMSTHEQSSTRSGRRSRNLFLRSRVCSSTPKPRMFYDRIPSESLTPRVPSEPPTLKPVVARRVCPIVCRQTPTRQRHIWRNLLVCSDRLGLLELSSL